MQLSTFHGFDQVLTQSQGVQPKVNTEQLVHNPQYARLFRPLFVKGSVRSEFFAIIVRATEALLEQCGSVVQSGVVARSRLPVRGNRQAVRAAAHGVQGRYQRVAVRRRKDLIEGGVQNSLTFVRFNGMALRAE